MRPTGARAFDQDFISGDAVVARARRLAARYRDVSARETVEAAIKVEFPGRIALVSSFGAESAPLLHLVASIDPAVPVIFLETGKHFAQTLAFRRSLARDLGLADVRDVRPAEAALASEDPRGDLWRADQDACCDLRKVRPLAAALRGFDAWITGRKQFHGGLRALLPAFEASAGFVKVNPLVRWSTDDLADYERRWGLERHPLVAEGFTSIGCWPCTHPTAPGEDRRAGRWRGAAKTECGIHAAAALAAKSGRSHIA
jgi:phosphoadenosine phosphosulfate reductase